MKRDSFKGNRPLMIGALASFVYFGAGHFIELPDAVRGFLLGLGAAGYVLGILTARLGFARLRGLKKSLLQKLKP